MKPPNLFFHDHRPKECSLLDAVREGLTRSPRAIAPKFFYDARGSVLFDAICEQPEYYPPRIERELLRRHARDIAALAGTARVLIEPGAGSASKVRLLLDTLQPAAYVPMDISHEHLQTAAARLAIAYPDLPVHACCVDFTHSLPLPEDLPSSVPRLLFFPGSSLGNFEPENALAFLRLCRETAGEGGLLLIGVDTKKAPDILNAAYNDAAGVTAAFNRNLLSRIREELDVEIDPEGFDHHAFYNADAGRVEMHLVSRCQQRIRLPGEASVFDFAAGESLCTEYSYKYAPQEFEQLAAAAGFRPIDRWLDDEEMFGVYLLSAAPA